MIIVMRYMVDAMLYGLAKELREKGVDCQTATKFIRGDEDSRISISDPDIIDFLLKNKRNITLITADTELAKYCQKFNIPYIRIQDLVIETIKKRERVNSSEV
jgi:uncharacterized protein with PIN domain